MLRRQKERRERLAQGGKPRRARGANSAAITKAVLGSVVDDSELHSI